MLKRISQSFRTLIPTLLILGFVVGLLGCKEKAAWQEPAPEEVFRTLLMDWFRGERQKAFESIVESDRDALRAPIEALKQSPSAQALPDDYEALVVGRVNNPYDFKSIAPTEPLESAPEPGQSLELTLHFHDGHRGHATMVWSGERWLVDLELEDISETKTPPKPAPEPPDGETPSAETPDAQTAQDAPDASSESAPEPIDTNLPTTPSNTP